MQYSQQIIVKRWIPILKEYERTKAKIEYRKNIKNIDKKLKEDNIRVESLMLMFEHYL